MASQAFYCSSHFNDCQFHRIGNLPESSGFVDTRQLVRHFDFRSGICPTVDYPQLGQLRK